MKAKLFLRATLSHLKEASKIKYSTLSALGTYLVLWSSLIPFSNNIIEVFYPSINTTIVEAANNKLASVIWSLGICFQPTIIILVKELKPYILSYIFPIFTSLYSSSFYFLPLLGYTPNEDIWFFVYMIFTTFIIWCVMFLFNFYIKVLKRREKQNEIFQQEYLNSYKN